MLCLLLGLGGLPARRAAAQAVLPDTAGTGLRTVPLGGSVLDKGWIDETRGVMRKLRVMSSITASS